MNYYYYQGEYTNAHRNWESSSRSPTVSATYRFCPATPSQLRARSSPRHRRCTDCKSLLMFFRRHLGTRSLQQPSTTSTSSRRSERKIHQVRKTILPDRLSPVHMALHTRSVHCPHFVGSSTTRRRRSNLHGPLDAAASE